MSSLLLLPETTLVLGVIGLLLCEAGFFGAKHRLLLPVSVLAILAFLIQTFLSLIQDTAWPDQLFYRDWWGFSVRVFLSFVALVCVTLEEPGLLRSSRRSEFYVMVLAAVVGGSALVHARQSIVQWSSLNLLYLSVFWIIGYDKRSGNSSEAAFKFLLSSVLSSLMFLVSVVFLSGRSLESVGEIGQIGILMLWTASLSFIVGTPPLSFAHADISEGAPLSARFWLWAGLPVIGIAVLIRGLYTIPEESMVGAFYRQSLLFLGVLSMFFGAAHGLTQQKLRRIFFGLRTAVSGVILIGISRMGADAPTAVIAHHWTSTFGFIALIVILDLLERQNQRPALLGDLRYRLRTYSVWPLLFIGAWASLMMLPPFQSGTRVFAVMTRLVSDNALWVVVLWGAIAALLLVPLHRATRELGRRAPAGAASMPVLRVFNQGVWAHGVVISFLVLLAALAIPLSDRIDAMGLLSLQGLNR